MQSAGITARDEFGGAAIADRYGNRINEVLAYQWAKLNGAAMKLTASVRWTGAANDGIGMMNTESGALEQNSFSWRSPLQAQRETNPAELIAAAHAASFSMALANELGSAGFLPTQIETIATATMETAGAGRTMVTMKLEVAAKVPKAAQEDFIDATLRAKMSCPVSRLLRVNFSMNAKLEK